MAKTVNVDEIDYELYKLLMTYNKDVTEATKEAVDNVAEGVMREIKSHITWNDKVYSKAFQITKIYDNDKGKYVIWHVGEYEGKQHWRLTHLLELGHITRDGTNYSKKFPHVKYGQLYAYNNLLNEIKGRIERVQ